MPNQDISMGITIESAYFNIPLKGLVLKRYVQQS